MLFCFGMPFTLNFLLKMYFVLFIPVPGIYPATVILLYGLYTTTLFNKEKKKKSEKKRALLLFNSKTS